MNLFGGSSPKLWGHHSGPLKEQLTNNASTTTLQLNGPAVSNARDASGLQYCCSALLRGFARHLCAARDVAGEPGRMEYSRTELLGEEEKPKVELL